jgi:hypothetical protein
MLPPAILFYDEITPHKTGCLAYNGEFHTNVLTRHDLLLNCALWKAFFQGQDKNICSHNPNK